MKFAYKGEIFESGSSSENANVYSTEETVIGTWIDGKPIYRKVFETTSASSASSFTTIDVSELNIDSAVRGFGVCTTSDGVDQFINTVGSVADAYSFIDLQNKTTLRYKTTMSASFNRPIILILEYTKTTD